MFLIRTAFWLGLVVLLLPSDPQQQARLYNAAASAAHSAVTFCDRNAALCKTAGEHWAVFKTKAEFAGRMAVDLASEKLLGDGKSAQPAVGEVRDTLSEADRAPAWRGKAGRVRHRHGRTGPFPVIIVAARNGRENPLARRSQFNQGVVA